MYPSLPSLLASTDPVRPRLYLGWDPTLYVALKLALVEFEGVGFDPQLGQKGIHDERQTEIDRVSASNVIRIQSVTTTRRVQVDDLLDVVILKYLLQLALICRHEKSAVSEKRLARSLR
jgi:hypothetical protein